MRSRQNNFSIDAFSYDPSNSPAHTFVRSILIYIEFTVAR